MLDLGCGPGRLVAALAERGVLAIGVDDSPVAAEQCPVDVLRRDLFEPLPGEGRWAHVLLADGNIGIGGDPGAPARAASPACCAPAARRSSRPIRHPTPTGAAPIRLHTPAGIGPEIPWAIVGLRALAELAAAVGLRVTSTRTGARTFAQLARR